MDLMTDKYDLASVNGIPADLLDTTGRLVVTPHALTVDGQRNIPADLQPGENLHAFLVRHVPGITSGAWSVMVGGAVVPPAMWPHTYPKIGNLIACRAVVGKSALQLVAVAALAYFTVGTGAGWIAGAFKVGSGAAAVIGTGMYMAGSILINKVLGPKVGSSVDTTTKQSYSLSSQRNTARPYEPIPVLWGEMRVTPDLAGAPYTWFEGDDQYLSTILLGGINVHAVADLSIGDTPIGDYNDVHVYYNGLPGMPSQDMPLYSNTDSIAGAELDYKTQAWVARTSSPQTVAIAVDVEGQLFDTGGETAYGPKTVTLYGEYRAVGSTAWLVMFEETITNDTPDTVRRSYVLDVARGQYDVRVRCGQPTQEMDNSDTCRFAWMTLRSIQPDAIDYAQWGRIGIKIRATGQLSGSLDTLRATFRARPLPVWTGTQWINASTRAQGLSNPGAILLQTLRGVRDDSGQLQFGFGLDDAQIDIDGIQAFMLHCQAHGYTYDRWLTTQTSLGDFCHEVTMAGMGEFAWTDGSRPTAVFVSSGQPISAVVNMANMISGSFSVDYTLSNAADGIEYQYVDRERNWETQTLRVSAPGVTTMLNPARVVGDGVTAEAHAAVLARYHLAQSLYQYKTIGYTADIEHLDYRRLALLSISHDLTQWGFGGRLVAAQRVGGQIQLVLDETVPPLATPYIGLRIPGERDWRVGKVLPFAVPTDTITVLESWPMGLPLPGDGADNPAHDTLWCYDFKPTPGYRVRVVGMEPDADLTAKISCVPEGPEFWNYVLHGVYEPAPNQSSFQQAKRPQVKNLRVTEQIHHQGNTEWYELHAVWDIEGDFDHAQVWAGRNGSQLRMVDGKSMGSRSTFRVDGAGSWLIQVQPFSPSGLAGDGASLLYVTAGIALPPYNPDVFGVLQVDGGLRRFGWAYTGQRPPSLAGVQIRYLPGDVSLSVDQWGVMTPLGHAGDIYTAQFETTQPSAGQWTFGLRAINTSGQLADGIVQCAVTLDSTFDNIEQPDLTPPPQPTGFEVTAALTSATLQTDRPSYTQGHGHDVTKFYRALVTSSQPNPAFADAQLALASVEHIGTCAVELGKTYHWWATWQSIDGMESVPAGPVTLTVGMIGNQDLGPLIVEAGNLAKGAVDAFHLTDGMDFVGVANGPALPTEKITEIITWGGKLYHWDGTQYTAKVPTVDLSGTINAQQIADNAITVDKISANAVTEGKLAAAAVTADKLAAAAVNITKFASGIEPVGIVAGSTLPTVKSTSAIMWGSKLYHWDGTRYTAKVPTVDLSGTINAQQIADNAITVDKISANAVTEGKLAAAAVTADKLAAAAVNITKFASGIEPVGIVAGSTLPTVKSTSAIMWGGKLYHWDGTRYTAAVAATDIVGRLTDTQIAAINAAKLTGQIVNTQIADNAISTPKLAAGAVTAAAIAAGAVTAGHIATYAITATKLATGSVTADKIAANAITAAQIAAGTITATELATNAVTAVKIAANAITSVKIAAGAITAGKIAAESVTAAEIAAGAITARQLAANSVTATNIAAGSITAIKIATYAVTADKIAIGSVTADKIAANAITAAQIAAGTITATELATNAVTAVKIAANAITSVKIAAGAITVGKIAAESVTAAEIAAGAITARQLAANSVTATNIAAGSITAIKIATYAVSADKIAANTITSDKIAANAITAAQIAAGAITAAKISVNAIAVGTGAIQNGAIVNAMIGSLSADKITTGFLNAARISAGSIDATKIAANAITSEKLAAYAVTAVKIASNSITTDKLNVASLSAISANMGTVTAGLIRNATNTSFWNLDATGSNIHFKLGNDLTYDAVNGLRVNKINVIERAQIASGAVSEDKSVKFAGPKTIVVGTNSITSFYGPGGYRLFLVTGRINIKGKATYESRNDLPSPKITVYIYKQSEIISSANVGAMIDYTLYTGHSVYELDEWVTLPTCMVSASGSYFIKMEVVFENRRKLVSGSFSVSSAELTCLAIAK